ncbi:MAG: type II secretion system secretin GspD [Myxococcales bacterium]|nr:type II secretion system secretin GspD [Myxococcales bacterium]
MKRKLQSVAGVLALSAIFTALPAFAQQAPPIRRPVPAPAAVPKQPAPAPAAPAAPGRPGAAPAAPDKEPPGAKGALPDSTEAIAKAADVPYRPKPGGHLVKFNLQDADLAELVNHISGMTGRRFIYGPKVRQVKATVVSPEPVTLGEAYEAFLSILEANGMTVVPHGRFLKIIDSAGSVAAPTPIYARGEPVPASDRYVTRLYRLKNVGADEAMALLSKFKSKEADISVYGPGQLLIMTDTGTNIRRMIRILEEIDVGGAGSRMWIEPVHYGSAADMAKRINELFELDKGQGAGGAGGGGLSKVVADEQTNSLIVVGTDDSYHKLLELMKRIDTQPAAEGKVHVMPLQHATAEELANVLTQMLQGARQPGQQGGPAGMFEGDVRVIADKATNSLVVTSSGRDYSAMRLVVGKLDRPRRQVFIEAVIMDVSVKHSSNLGVSFHGGTTADLGGGGDTLFLGGFEASNSLTFPANPELLQGVALGARGPELAGTSNLLGTGLSIPAFGVVLQALASSGDANVLATPHILATDNTAAEISVGENVPLQTNLGGGGLGSLAGLAGGQAGAAGALANLPLLAGGMGFNAPRQDVGIKIKVTPHLNETNQVRLEIEQEISEAGSAVGALGVVPITKRTARTTVEVDDQQTIVLGGLMREAERKSRKKIPVLGDLPVLGFLFRHSEVTREKLNLLLVLTPTVIHGQEDLRKIFERKMQERQEFIDRYFVFSGQDWKPPLDYQKTNGLVEEIRQAYAAVEEQQRLEDETRPRKLEHTPGEPIELPHSVKSGGAGGAAPAPAAPTPPRPVRPRQPRPATPPAADPGGNPPAPTPPPARGGSLDSPIRINPIARSVGVERVE